MTTLDEIVIAIKADPRQFEREMKKAGVTVDTTSKKMDKDLKKVDKSTGKLSKSFDGLKKSVIDSINPFKALGTVIAGVGIAKLGTGMVKAASDMQKLNARLVATTGSVENAAEAMQFLRTTAEKQSVDLLNLADGYNRLLPAVKGGKISMEEMRTTLKLVNDNILAFGLSTENTRDLFYGLSQVLTSGTVTMEDMRQVTEKLPGSFDLIATSMGESTNSLRDLIGTGTVTADQLLPHLMKALEANEGAAGKMANTFSAASARMGNSFRDAAANIAKESGFLDALVVGINGITAALDFMAGKNSEAKIAEDEHNKSLERAKELYDLIKEASGERLEQLKLENDRLLKNAQAQVEVTKAQIADLVAKSEALAKLRSQDTPQDLDTERSRSNTLVLGSEDYARRKQLDYIDRINTLNNGLDEQQKRLKELKITMETGVIPATVRHNKAQGNAAKIIKKNTDLLSDFIDALEFERKLIGLSNEEKAEEVAKRTAINKIMKEQSLSQEEVIKLYSEEIEKIGELAKGNEKLKEAHQNAADAAEEMAKASEHAAREIQDSLADSIADVIGNLDDLEGVGERVFNNIKKHAINSFAEIAAQQIMGSGGSGGAGGFNLGSIFGGGGASGNGGFSLSNLSGILTSSLISPNMALELGATAADIAGNFGASLGTQVGIEQGVQSAAGAFNFAGIGGGIVGNLGANAIFGGNRGVGASIGGAAGGIAGGILGSSAGLGFTAALAPVLGPLAPVVGPLVGSFIGNALGGLIGGGTPTQASEFGTVAGQTEFGSKNADPKIAKGLSESINAMLIGALSAGLDLTGSSFRGGFNTNQFGGGFLQANDKTITFDIEDAEDVQRGINELIQELIRTADIADNDVAEALRNLNLEGKSAAEVIREIGIATGRLADEFDMSLEDEILKMTDARAYETKQLKAHTDALREEAIAIGANVELVDEYERLKMASIDAVYGVSQLSSQFMKIAADLRKTALDLGLGNLSAISPEDQLSLARTNFEDLSRRAALGDVEAGQSLSGAATAFLQESRDYYGSSSAYKSDFANVQSGLMNASNTFERNANNQSGVVDAINKSTQANAQGQGAVIKQLDALTTQVLRVVDTNREIGIIAGART